MGKRMFGYARCSTNERRQDIDRQKREMRAAGVAEKDIFFEYESGSKEDRDRLTALLDYMETGDTLVTTEVSRITRSTKQLCELINLIQERRLKLIIIGSVTIDCRDGEMDAMTKAFLQMAGVFSELELNITSARIKSGMANAKAKGKTFGRPEITVDKIPDSFLRYYPRYKAGQLKIAEIARLLEMSRTTVYKYIRILES